MREVPLRWSDRASKVNPIESRAVLSPAASLWPVGNGTMFVWSRIVGFLLVGYLCMKRSFAYLGVPPIFIGEVALVAFVLLKPRVAIGTWVSSLLRPSPLNGLGLALLLFVLCVLQQVGRGILSGTPPLYTLKYFVFQLLYTVHLFWNVDLHSPEYLSKMVRVLAWTNGIYGLLYIALLRHVEIAMPISNMPLFSPAGRGAVAILGLLCFERNLRGVWLVLALNILVTLAWQVRAEWFGLAVGVLAWGILTGRFGRVVAARHGWPRRAGDNRIRRHQAGWSCRHRALAVGHAGSSHRPDQSGARKRT